VRLWRNENGWLAICYQSIIPWYGGWRTGVSMAWLAKAAWRLILVAEILAESMAH